MKIDILVFRRPNMFKVHDDLTGLVGLSALEKMFSDPDYKVRPGSELTLFYPERFLNIIEQRALCIRAESVGFESIKITTSSVYIIQSNKNNHIRIVQDNEIKEDGGHFKLSNDYSGQSSIGLHIL